MIKQKKSGLADSPFFKLEEEMAVVPNTAIPTDLPSASEIRPESAPNPTQKTTQVITHVRDISRENSRENPRDISRENSRENPRDISRGDSPPLHTRDEVQAFSFQLRDKLKIKVQAEVPHEWRVELEKISHDLNVKKMELYRYIYGEFLGKVKQKE